MGYTISKNQVSVKKGFVRYRFDTTILTGKRERKQIVCQASAVNTLYRRWENELLEKSSGKFKLFEKIDEYLDYCKIKKTKREYLFERALIENVIKKFFKSNVLIMDINRGNVEDFIVWRKQYIAAPKYSQSFKRGYVTNATINRNIAVLQYIFNYFIRKQYCSSNPFTMSKLKINNYREVNLNTEQIKELLKKAKELNSMFYNVIIILLLTGMRKMELFDLQWNEVDLENSIIRLSALKTKSKRQRIIPITPALHKILLSIMDNKNEFVISRYTINILAKDWDKLLKMVNCKTISDGSQLRIHDLRHVFAQTLLNNGVQLEDIQSLLGHQSIQTTQNRYAMYSRLDLLEKASLIDKIIQ